MIRQIDLYITRQVVSASLLTLFKLAALLALFKFLDQLTDLGRGNYQVSDIFMYIILWFPTNLVEIFPTSVLIGTLFGLGSLASNSELTILRAAGMSTWEIASAAVKASLLLMIFIIVLGEWVVPVSSKAAQQLRSTAINSGNLSFSKTGLWARQDLQIIQLGNVLSDGRISEVTLYNLTEDNSVSSIVKAESASKIGEQWVLSNSVETRFLPGRVISEKQPSQIWTNPLAEPQLEALTLNPDSLSLIALLNYLDYLQQNGLQTGSFQLAFWRKLAQPVGIAVMVFLAVSFVLGPVRNVSMGARVFTGVLLGLGFHIANQLFGPVSLVMGLWPIFGAIVPLAIFTLLAYWLMRRVH
jgi:lipopolysaccharide export system permease protein